MIKVIVTGGDGMMGQTIKKITNDSIYHYKFINRKILDLTHRNRVLNYFKYYASQGYNHIIHLAANVGGLYKNMESNIDMFSDNIRINENILEACYKYNIKRGIFVLSSCIFPCSPSKFPMDETMIHESPPHYSNEGYSYAKRMLELQCRQYNKLGCQFICLTPVNLYGPYDNFNLKNSHMIPGLMHRFYLTKQTSGKYVAYGTGNPLRQFLYSEDFAEIILQILHKSSVTDGNIICCNDKEYSIKEIVNILASVMSIKTSDIVWDTKKSDGCMKKTVSNSKLKSIIDCRFTDLNEGLMKTYRWFNQNFYQIRK